jgi:hypothetical protein
MHFVEFLPFFRTNNKFSQFKFELAGGNDGTGLGNVFISLPFGFLWAYLGSGDDNTLYLNSKHRRDIWRVQFLGTDKCRYVVCIHSIVVIKLAHII